MDRRLLPVILAGVVLIGVCTWRVAVNRPLDLRAQMQAALTERPAAVFEGLDADNQMFRLERYLGRHRILLVFYDGELGVAEDPTLRAVLHAAAELETRDVKVVAVSTALPQQNRPGREQVGGVPFPLVSDVDLTIHQRWGRTDGATGKPLTGVFLISRKGTVACLGATPQPASDVPALLQELTH